MADVVRPSSVVTGRLTGATQAYLYPMHDPADALDFGLFPDKSKLSFGTHVHASALDGEPTEAIQVGGLKAVSFEHSLIFDDTHEGIREEHGACAFRAWLWILRHFTARAQRGVRRIFRMQVIGEPEWVVIESADLDPMYYMDMERYPATFRFDFKGRVVRPITVSPEILGLRPRSGKKRPKKPKAEEKELDPNTPPWANPKNPRTARAYAMAWQYAAWKKQEAARVAAEAAKNKGWQPSAESRVTKAMGGLFRR